VRRLILLGTAAACYLVAAWMVAPGFYDGFQPLSPYNWVSPPPQAPPGNLPPKSGHVVIKVLGGVSDAGSAYTDDGQIVLGFLPGAFDATGKTSITVDLKPEATYPTATGLQFVTNVYLVIADASLVKDTNVVMIYSNILPAPSFIYVAPSDGGAWKSIGGTDNANFTIQSRTRQLGYFAAGYSGSATSKSSSTSQLLPIAVAVLIIGVLVAGIPLAMFRRRRAAGDVEEADDDEDDEDDEPEPPATPRT
jgi:hypothetical protein